IGARFQRRDRRRRFDLKSRGHLCLVRREGTRVKATDGGSAAAEFIKLWLASFAPGLGSVTGRSALRKNRRLARAERSQITRCASRTTIDAAHADRTRFVHRHHWLFEIAHHGAKRVAP